MSDLLITLLGRVPNTDSGYRTTVYEFDDGFKTESVAFFGWSLQQRLKSKRVVILGTSGSMWDHLFELDIDFGGAYEQERLELADLVEQQSVTQAYLNKIQHLLSAKLDYQIELKIIPYCKNEIEQIELLQIMANEVKDDETVHLDITHGFRHLPMLSLLAALYLQQIRHASIEGIWYGSFDTETGSASVINLTGLLRISEGIQALSKFNQDGNYGSFIPMLGSSGLDQTICTNLREAAYYENVLNVGEATGKLRKVLPSLEGKATLSPETQLLLPIIKERLNWVAENKQFEKQIKLAQRSLEQRDYLRATLYAYEAVLTRLCQQTGADVSKFDSREEARKGYEQKIYQQQSQESKDYKLLKNLRNNIAHGSRGNKGDVQKALLNENILQEKLSYLINEIKAHNLPVEK